MVHFFFPEGGEHTSQAGGQAVRSRLWHVALHNWTMISEHYIFAFLYVLNVIFFGFWSIHILRIRHRPISAYFPFSTVVDQNIPSGHCTLHIRVLYVVFALLSMKF